MKVFSLFHTISKNRRDESYNPDEIHNRDNWPDSWKTTQYKTYPRFTTIPLSRPQPIPASVSQSVLERHSTRVYTSSLTETAVSNLLYYSVGEIDPDALDGRGRRACASAGARYPIETYVLLLKNVEGLSQGLYHYAVETHGLTILRRMQLSPEELEAMFRHKETQHASMVLFFTGVFSREVEKYGERGYRNVLLEAGGIGQQLYVLAQALGVGCVALSGVDDEVVERMIGVDGLHESMVHTIVIG